MSYIHPAAVEHHRKRWMRPDAYRFAPPGSPEAKPPGYLHPWAAVARAEEAKAAADEAEQDEFERELLALRHELAKIRLDYELRRFQQKYSPDQPRVPAGSGRESGRWTDGGGRPGAQYAQGGYPVDLLEEEARGGHTIEKHVNRSPEALIAQVREVFDERPNAHDVRSGSFPSVEAATKLVSSTLAQNQAVVDRVASGELSRAVVLSQFGSVTGTEAAMANSRSQPYFQDTYGVGVVIIHDPSSPRRYGVVSAFPSNRRLP